LRLLRLCIATVAVMMIMASSACAYEVLILQSSHAAAYDEALQGVRAMHRFSERLLVLSDYNHVDIQQIVREEHPKLLVVLGDAAYATARKIRQLPVVVLMAPNYRGGSAGHPAMTGVTLYLPPERYLALFHALKLHRVGMLGHPGKSGQYIRWVQKVAPEYAVEPVVREVASPRDVSGQLNSLQGQVDALWLLPDDTAVARETVEAYFLFSLQQQVPVIAFSGAYLQSGAAVALDLNRHDMGRQAGSMVAALLDGKDVANLPVEFPRKAVVRTNLTVLRRLGFGHVNLNSGAESR